MRALGASIVLMTAMTMSGCSLLSESATPTETSQGTSVPVASSAPSSGETGDPAKPAAPTVPAERSAAEAFSNKAKDSLTKLASTTKAPNREQMLAAMLEAGAVKEKTELSVDITPTGLAVDAIEAATRVADKCVIAQVRDGKVAVTILPVLASGRCFVGDVH